MNISQYIQASLMWNEGVPAKVIARTVGVGVDRLYSYSCRYRKDFPLRRPRATPEQDARMRELVASGVPVRDISAEVGLSETTVRNHTRGMS